MKDIKRLLYVVIGAAFFIGLYIMSDIYAGEAIGKYAYEISEGSGKLQSNEKVTLDSLSVENQIMDYVSSVSHQEIRLTFLGDITFEDDQLERYYNSSSESFDFSDSFQYIKNYLVTSSFVSANFEAVMAGADTDYDDVYEQYGTAGFLYNIPEVAAQNMKDAGISLLQTANEHAGDFGNKGVKSTINFLEDAGLVSAGTLRSATEKRYSMVAVSGLKVGYVAYTNDLNRALSSDNTYAINHLDDYNEKKVKQMCEDVRSARRDGADFVVAMVYAGEVSQFRPDDAKKDLYDQLFKAGADIVIGTEPYAVQPMEIRTLTDSDGLDKKGIAIYSLGTFLGSEVYKSSSGIDNDISVILDIVIDKEGTKNPTITGFRLTPTCITYTEDDVYVLPALEVKNNPDEFDLDEKALERANIASEELIPWVLNDVNVEGEYVGNTYIVNF